MTKALMNRIARLMPNGIPKWLRIYDNNGESLDRYTVVYTSTRDGVCHCVSMSESPFTGVCQHGEHTQMIDRPKYAHLGKKITFQDLPKQCQRAVIEDYCEIWGLPLPANLEEPMVKMKCDGELPPSGGPFAPLTSPPPEKKADPFMEGAAYILSDPKRKKFFNGL